MTTVESQAPMAHEPKRLYRIVEPSYADLAATEPGEFFRSAAQRTRERFGQECGIRTHALAWRQGSEWRPVPGSDASLIARIEALSPGEQEEFLLQHVAFSPAPFPVVLWLLGTRGEWLAVFRLEEPPDEGRALLLQMARLAVQQRALEAGWTGARVGFPCKALPTRNLYDRWSRPIPGQLPPVHPTAETPTTHHAFFNCGVVPSPLD
jgi:hypothetical protein